MHIVVHANSASREEWLAKKTGAVQLSWVDTAAQFAAYLNADAFFDLKQEDQIPVHFYPLHKPVFVHAVAETLREIDHPGIIRINAWTGFLQRPVVEIVARPSQQATARTVMEALDWQWRFVPDTPGIIAARIVAMVINEAYFTLGDGVSNREEIDTAMKLGANYPHGPFEWSQKIGVDNIYRLLVKLGETNGRYAIAPALRREALGG